MTMAERVRSALFDGVLSAKDAALITSDHNSRYVSGFPSSARLLLIVKEQVYFLTDFRYAEAAEKKVQGCTVLCYQKPEDTLRALLQQHEIENLLFEYDALRYGQFVRYDTFCKNCGVHPIFDKTLDTVLYQLRAQKQPQELAKIKAAQAITDAAFADILPKIRPGVTERQLALEIEFFMKRNGAEALAFDLIVVSGENGSQCHGVPGDKQIQKGEFITMDIGAVVDGYHSDMTRTVALGQITDEQKRIYDKVLEAQLAACNAVRPGIPCNRVDFVARSILEEAYPGAFGHSTGHSVGIEIHEMPAFAPACQTLTQPGMVITVEPGLYLAGKCGVRIEDMVLITEDGHENLTHSPKELILL